MNIFQNLNTLQGLELFHSLLSFYDGDFTEVAEIMKSENPFERPEICARCKKPCCTFTPCSATPGDFDHSIKKMVNAIESENYSIILIQKPGANFNFRQMGKNFILAKPEIVNNPNLSLCIRPRAINRPIVDIMTFSIFVGQCVFLGEKGCTLKFKERPTLAQQLIPSKTGKCFELYDLSVLVDEWHGFSAKLYSLAKKYFDSKFPDNKNFKLL